MQPESDSQPLSYAQKPTAARRWRWRIVFGVLAVTIGLLAWTRGPAVWDRAMLLYWQRQCLNYSVPADQVVYENYSENPTAHLATGGTFLEPADSRMPSHRAIGRIPPAAVNYLARRQMALAPGESIVYMGERVSYRGTRRLVMVIIDDKSGPGSDLESAVKAWSMDIVGWRDIGPQDLKTYQVKRGRGGLEGFVEIWAGQPSPGDAEGFMIPFRRTEDGMIEGRIGDAGSIDLEFQGSKSDGFTSPMEDPILRQQGIRDKQPMPEPPLSERPPRPRSN